MTRETLKIPYIKETEELVFVQLPRIWETLAENKVLGPSRLRGLVFNYPNTLLLNIQKPYHVALTEEEEKTFRAKPHLSDYVGELSYLLPRFAENKTIQEIFERIKNEEKVQIHFAERFEGSLEETQQLKRPAARGRRYFEEVDENGDLHIYFEIRRQTINDENNPPTDFLELMSFLGFYEMTRFLVKLSINNPDFLPKVGKARKKLIAIINRFFPREKYWRSEDLENWANSSGGLYLSNSFSRDGVCPLFSLREREEKHQLALYDGVMKIGLETENRNLPPPDSIVLGNEFTFPLILAIPLLTEGDLQDLSTDPEANKEGKPLDLLPPSIKKEKLDSLTKNTLIRFMYLQFLSRYNGQNKKLRDMRTRIFNRLRNMGVITRICEAEETALGDPVDYYDFSKLDKNYVDKLIKAAVVKDLKDIILNLKYQRKRILNFSYPLGDNTYGLIEAISDLIPEVRRVVFFGKVGATLQWDGENNLGARVGRVVYPEYTSSINNFNPEQFENFLRLYDIPLPVIVDADQIEAIFQSEGVLLQTLSDIKKAQEAIMARKDIPYQNKIRLLIDMESYYLNLICRAKDIHPAVIYYTSDNTRIPPIPADVKESIITSLGPRGSFAVMVAGLGALGSLLY